MTDKTNEAYLIAENAFNWLIVNWELDGEVIADEIQPELKKIMDLLKEDKMIERLKPCPFCNTVEIAESFGCEISCRNPNCGATIESTDDDNHNYSQMEMAVILRNAWNTRPFEDRQEKVIAALKKALAEAIELEER